MSHLWISFIQHSLRYIIHRHTYASSYANDIAMLWPILDKFQRNLLHVQLSAEVRDDDDEDVRRLVDFADPGNRWMVHSKATKRQIEAWIKNNNVISTGDHKALETQILCFKFGDRYSPSTDTAQRTQAT